MRTIAVSAISGALLMATLAMPAPSFADTLSDLQAQIMDLIEQILRVQEQINALTASSTPFASQFSGENAAASDLLAATLSPGAQQSVASQGGSASCAYGGRFFTEGAEVTDTTGASLTCTKGQWYYVTGVSVCVKPGFLLDTQEAAKYRLSLGCPQ